MSSKQTKSKPLKFLFLITHYYPHVFGAELFAQKLAEYLVSQNHHVDAVTGLWDHSWSIFQNHHGVNIHRVSTLKVRYLQTNYFIWPQLKFAQQLLNQNHYDFIHAHIYPSLVTGSLLKTKAKKIVTLQGGDLADYSEIFSPFPFLFKPLIASSLKKYHRIHGTSHHLESSIKNLCHKKATVIPNGVDSSLLQLKANKSSLHKKLKFPKTKLVAFSSSRLTPKNNLKHTIDAIKIVRKKGIDVGLVIAGSGHLHSKLQQQINQNKLNQFVKLLGPLPHRKTLEALKASDLFIRVPLQEGFGIAPLEALAVGTPVIANQIGGLADFISPQNSFVPSNTSVTSIAQTIKSFASTTPQNINKKTSNGQQLVKQKFTWDAILPTFTQQIYQI